MLQTGYLEAAPGLYNQDLPTEQQRDRICVVLVSPRNPLNSGGAARAMANFGLSQLSVVSPYAPHWREAKSAVGAPGILKGATVANSLANAVRNCTLVAGTGTLTYRKPEQRVIQLPDLPALVREELDHGGRFALVFGPEKHGLTRDDLSYCHVLVEIPTDPRQPSMNLGQAAAVCLYELVRAGEAERGEVHGLPPNRHQAADWMGHPGFAEQPSVGAAKSGNLERLGSLIEEVMLAADYSPDSMRDANRHDLRV